ncbi:MAG: LamG domain-containing protein [Bacteroidia bacterium]|nr:MAG: LamG domain-containing protein [Bacteroidia bacterium]
MKNKILIITAVLIAINVSCKKDPGTSDKTYPTDGLISYFNFDDNLADQLSATPDGNNHGSAVFTEGKAGKAILLNGSGQYIEFGRSTFRNGNNISVSVWLKRAGNGGLYCIMCDDFGIWSSNTDAGMAISLPSTNSASGAITQNEWTHLVGTYDGNNIKVYINGILKETKNHPGTIISWVGNLKVGKFDAEFWGGSVDDLFIYNKVLSQSEVDQLYDYH